MATEIDRDWARDKERFVEHFRRQGPGSRGTRVADDRARIWSPLARQFAELGRDLLGARTVEEVVRRVVAVALEVVPGAGLASVTLRLADGHLATPSCTDERAVLLDELQDVHNKGPFEVATRRAGTGMSGSPDVLNEPTWSEFGARAAKVGVRSVMSIGMFPTRGKGRLGTLNLYATEPRGLAAADPEVVLVLASHAATALGTVNAATERGLLDAPVTVPLRSSDVIERATEVLLEKRHLSPEEVYDVLRRSSANLLKAWRT